MIPSALQHRSQPWKHIRRALFAPLLGLAFSTISATAGLAQDIGLRAQTPSGEPVPRYMSLGFDEVNGRRGPGLDYQIRWLYVREGLPVQVIAETRTWRKVRDPDGDIVWMHRRTLARKRTVIVRTGLDAPVPLHAHPNADSAIVANAEPGVIFALDTCQNDWCRVDGRDAAGWTPAAGLWGVDAPSAPTTPAPEPQSDARPQPARDLFALSRAREPGQ